MRITRLPLALALLAALPAAASAQERPRPQEPVRIPPLYRRYVPPPAQPGTERAVSQDSLGLRFRVSQGSGHAATPARGASASWSRLSERETAALLARLPALPADRSPADSFAFPAQTLAAPRAGNVVLAEFPPKEAPPARPVESGAPAPLAVARRAPEGEVAVGAEVTVTFSQPMVPLASVGDVAARAVPVRLTPQAPGRWRWIDVRTVKFEPTGRLPMATDFTVEVPAGTVSAAGGRTAAAERWTFSTPPPTALGGYPYSSPVGMRPVFVIAFDQRIDPAAVLRALRVTAGGVPRAVHLATAAELDADPEAKAIATSQESGRWLAFRATLPLPRDADVRIVLPAGTPSAEGPRGTRVEQGWNVRTYGVFRMTGSQCGWDERCRPGDSWRIDFSNPVEAAAFRDSLVRVTPALPGLSAWVGGNSVNIVGRARPNTRYTVRLGAGVKDRFGQTLAAPVTAVFDVGAPEAELQGPGGEMMVLDPAARPAVSVFSHDHPRLRVRVQRVTADDWPAYRAFLGNRDEKGKATRLPGRTVADRVVSIDAPAAETRETRVDLSPALSGGVGQAIIAVEAVEGATPEERRQGYYLWVQATRIAVTAFSDNEEMVAWASSLVDGAPLSGVRVALRHLSPPTAAAQPAPAGETGSDGTATLPLPTRDDDVYLVAERGGDVALLPRGVGNSGWAAWRGVPAGAFGAWYAVTDRNLYRPGETVRFKGWVRLVSQRKGGSVELPGARPGDQVAFTVFDPRNNEIAKGTAALTALAGFDGSFTVPEGTNLGVGRIELRYVRDGVDRWRYATSFQVQEFRRPEYTVSAEAEPGPHLVGGSAEVTARAAYYAGGALPGAPVAWEVTATPGYFTPPGWSGWSFGRAGGWEWLGEWDGAIAKRKTFEGTTDASGAHALRLDFDGAEPPRPYNVSATATVTDVNRQAWSAGAQLLVHPAALYVGARMERAWLELGDSIDLDVIVVDLDGKPVAGTRVEARAVRRTWSRAASGGSAQNVQLDWSRCETVSAPQPVRCVFRPDEPGLYQVTLEVRDGRERLNRTTVAVWVTGRDPMQMGPDQGNDEHAVRLTPDRETYAPGDTARVLVRLPFTPARGMVTLRRAGLLERYEIDSREPTYTLRVPIREEHVPGLTVQVDLVGAAPPSPDDSASARGVDYASGSATLSVPPATRALKVLAVPADSALEPDSETALDVEVRDAAGRPVSGAEVAVVVVDEAVLALTGYTFADPLSVFYPFRAPGVNEVRLHPMVRVEAPDYAPAPGTLVGRVVSASTGEPVAQAQVHLAEPSRSATTDTHGRFRITGVPAGPRTVEVTRVGYRAARVAVAVGAEAPPPLRVSLVGETMELNQVVATGRAGMMERRSVASAAYADAPMPAMAPPPPPPPPPPGEGGAAPIVIRTNFDPLAVFSPAERTGPDGRLRIAYKVPSNLTRYRVVAIAVEGATKYGVGESGITARRGLMVRPSAPRFANFGDRFELPVVLQNQTGTDLRVDVAARAVGLSLYDAGRRVTVPAHDRVEVRIPAEAVRAGPARFQVAVSSGARADAAEGSLPVWTPATSEAFAAYGSFEEGAATLPLQVPGDAIPAFGGLEVTTSSTALQELTDALLYLVRYPYECAEQVSSRIMAVAGLRDVLTAFKADEMPAPDSLAASVALDVRALAAMQNSDGGFGFWRRGDESWPYVSIHAAHALTRAREKGYPVPQPVLDASLQYLRRVPGNVPGWYPPEVKRALEAYALYVRDRMGDSGAAGGVRRLVAAHGRALTLEEQGWLLSAAAGDAGLKSEADSLLRWIGNRATETASTATFATAYTEGEYLLLHSARRSDAIVLEALLQADPRNELVVKTVRGLLGHRVRGRWDNTQENAWVLLALDRYFRVYEGQTPEFVARVWLGDRYAGGHTFSGRSGDRALVSVPMRALAAENPPTVTIGKEGPARVYWRAGLRYAPRDLDVTPLDAGFAVERTYAGVDDPADVTRGEDGRWRVKAGARVRVTVKMTAPSRRLHVALVDPLPAGFEPVNPELQGAQPSPSGAASGGIVGEGRYGWWRPWWHEHQNLRDDRAEAFTTLLPAGVYTYSYVARATTPGIFIVPPPRAEEMYTPETFGRGHTDRVIIVMPEEGAK